MNSTARPTKASSAPHSTQQQRSPDVAVCCRAVPGGRAFGRAGSCCPAGSAAAEVTPPITIAVVSQTVLLQGAAPTAIVPIRLDADNSRKVEFSAAFSLDYDSACLAIDPADANHDGIPDAVSVSVPADFEKSVSLNVADGYR